MQDDDLTGMKLALEEARAAAGEREVPVGAVVMCKGEVIARDHNRIVQREDPTAHAEMLVLQRATKKLGVSVADRLHALRHARTLCDVCRCDGARPIVPIGLRRVRSQNRGLRILEKSRRRTNA